MLPAEPGEAVVLAHLLVRARGKDDVSRRLEAFAGQRGQRHGARGHLALHVERPAAPDVSVAELTRPRVDRPLGRIREHCVGMREEEERRPLAAARQARDEIRPFGHFGVELAGNAGGLEVATKQRRRRGLVARGIDGVEADQLAEELGRLLAEPEGGHAVSILSP
jgi:hypothetical protein